MFNLNIIPEAACCIVDRTATVAGLSFDAFVVVATIVFLFIFSRSEKKFIGHFAVTAFAVFIFEMFTSPLWQNPNLGKLAYIYQDVSWVLTIGWTTMILAVVLLVDTFFVRMHEKKRFFLYILGMSLVGFVAEIAVMNIGLRAYSTEVLNTLWGTRILNVPIEALYYIPVFSALVIGFYKYWANVLGGKAVVPERRKRWARSLGLSVIAVFLFELMIEPMVVNANLPSWSYIYHDISILMTVGWIIIVWIAILAIDKFFIHYNLVSRFTLYLLTASAMALPLEAWFMTNGYRVYGESAVKNFSGYTFPVLGIPVEVVFAIPLYLALVIAFIRYWEIILVNQNQIKE